MAPMEDCNQMAADCVVLSCCCQCLLLQFLAYLFLKLPRRLLHRTREYARKKLLKMRSRKKVETELAAARRRSTTAKFGEMFADVYNKDESMCIDIGLLEEFKRSNANDNNSNSIIDHFDMGRDDRRHHHQCMEEIERVLDEYHARGEFGFGSFWRKEVLKMGSPSSVSSSSSSFSSSSPISWGRSAMASSSSTMTGRSSSSSSGGGGAKKKMRRKESGKGLRSAVQFELIEIVHSLSRYGSFQKLDKLLDYEKSPSGVWRNMSAAS